MKIRNRAQYVKGWPAPAITTFMTGLATVLMAASILTGSVANAASPPATIVHPEYTKPIIDPAAQPHWVTGIPNALADYFTFKPYSSDTAAVAAGFPSGVCGTGPTQEDCYTVSVKQFQQQLGLVDGSGALLSTTVWGYGSSTNAPAVGPFTAGVWHFPAPTFSIRSNRPARITWANELPNVAPAGFDPSYDCGPNAPNCFPYNRITTHVHGAHVADDSDGLTTAWYTPNDPATGKPSAVGPDTSRASTDLREPTATRIARKRQPSGTTTMPWEPPIRTRTRGWPVSSRSPTPMKMPCAALPIPQQRYCQPALTK